MKPEASIVQSVFDFAIREINALEDRIMHAEDDADAMLWEQAAQVVAQIEGGLSQRALARQWINGRTGIAYDEKHVRRVRKVYEENAALKPQERPRFRDAYNAIANAVHVSQNSGENEWYTPKKLIEAARAVLGAIDLDPASSESANEIVQAAQIFTSAEGGLTQRWNGRIWLNPPYAQPLVSQFCDKLAAEVWAGHVSAACVLVNNATETRWFGTLISVASAICFPSGRVRFWSPMQETAAPLQGQAVLYVGQQLEGFTAAFGDFGFIATVQRAV